MDRNNDIMQNSEPYCCTLFLPKNKININNRDTKYNDNILDKNYEHIYLDTQYKPQTIALSCVCADIDIDINNVVQFANYIQTQKRKIFMVCSMTQKNYSILINNIQNINTENNNIKNNNIIINFIENVPMLQHIQNFKSAETWDPEYYGIIDMSTTFDNSVYMLSYSDDLIGTLLSRDMYIKIKNNCTINDIKNIIKTKPHKNKFFTNECMLEIKHHKLLLKNIEYNDIEKGYTNLLHQLSPTNNLDEFMYINFLNSLNENHQIIVLEDLNNNSIIGTGTLFVEQKLIRNCGKVGHIEDIIIDNSYRGLGLGETLINILTQKAQNNGCYKVILYCDEKNVKFYEKCGLTMKGTMMAKYF